MKKVTAFALVASVYVALIVMVIVRDKPDEKFLNSAVDDDGDLIVYEGTVTFSNTSEYDKGANDALSTITLLSLELKLNDARMTWGEMCETVRERLRVAEDDRGEGY